MSTASDRPHGQRRPFDGRTLDGEALWCASCQRWIETGDGIAGAFDFHLWHPPSPHPARPYDT